MSLYYEEIINDTLFCQRKQVYKMHVKPILHKTSSHETDKGGLVLAGIQVRIHQF